jgi:hypothetical protein
VISLIKRYMISAGDGGTPVIPAFLEAEKRTGKVSVTPSLRNRLRAKGWGHGSNSRALDKA